MIRVRQERIKVSVIVLTYNHESYITQTLDSILMQKTDFPYEILVGDDNSTDHTADIIRSYATRYPNVVRPIFRKENIGATKNLYDLLNKAKGIYIANLEGDDFWTNANKLQIQVGWLEQHPTYIGSYHLCDVVDETGKPVKKPHWICERDVFRFQDFGGIFLPGHPSSWVYRNIYFNPKYDYSIIYKADSIIADRTIAMILLAQGNFALIRTNMSCYRSVKSISGENATSKIFVKQDNSKYLEYRLTIALEQYAKDILKVKANFLPFRIRLLLKAFVKFIIKPCKSRWKCIKNIILYRKSIKDNRVKI